MVKITVDEDCNNAPKKQFVKDLLIAAVNSDIEVVSDMLSDNVALEVVGTMSLSGKESVSQFLARSQVEQGVSELIVHTILSHGNKCAANGLFVFHDGSEVSFCAMYTFTSHSKSATIKEITMYKITLK